jgi:hypothetical protein
LRCFGCDCRSRSDYDKTKKFFLSDLRMTGYHHAVDITDGHMPIRYQYTKGRKKGVFFCPSGKYKKRRSDESCVLFGAFCVFFGEYIRKIFYRAKYMPCTMS